MAIKTLIGVRYSECDPMGVVHHTNYFIWYEIGRIALAHEAGITFHEIEDGSLFFLPVIECHNRFIASAHPGDIVEIETTLAYPYKTQLDFSYRAFRQKGHQLLTEGATSHVLTKPDGSLLWHFPVLFKQKIEAFLERKS